MAYIEDAEEHTLGSEHSEAAPDLAHPAPTRSSEAPLGSTPTATLTRREVEVLRLVAAGLTNKQVAGEFGLSVYTVESHLRSIYRKLKVTTRGAAIRYAFEHDIA